MIMNRLNSNLSNSALLFIFFEITRTIMYCIEDNEMKQSAKMFFKKWLWAGRECAKASKHNFKEVEDFFDDTQEYYLEIVNSATEYIDYKDKYLEYIKNFKPDL